MDPADQPTSSFLGRWDSFAAWLLKAPIALALAVICLAQLLSWAPSYLLWPWWADHDVFATAAFSWEAGIRPYRDYLCNNFPATIYLFWILGKVFGWGRTTPFWAFDLALVISLGIMLLIWSRRVFGRALPGLLSYALFMTFYLELNYALAGQREWHAGFFVVMSLLALQAWPGRASCVAAGLGMAIALAFRPQVVLFLPAIGVALGDLALVRGADGWRGRALRAVALWGVAFVVGGALLAWPLVRHGIADDFLQALQRVRPGSSYNRSSILMLVPRVMAYLEELSYWVIPLSALILLPAAAPADRRRAVVWLLTVAGSLLYLAISPYPHAYLIEPFRLTSVILAGVVAQMVLQDRRMTPSIRLLALVALIPGIILKPAYSAPMRSVRAIPILAGRATTDLAPTGYTATREVSADARYAWEDYRAVLDYVRDTLPPGQRVANALYYCPAIAGPAARLSAFPTESVAWLRLVDPSAVDRFTAALADGDVAVIWSPAESELLKGEGHCGPIVDVIRAEYRPDRQFGAIEVWVRKPPKGARTDTDKSDAR